MNWIVYIFIALIVIKFWNKAHEKVEDVFMDIIDNSNNTSKNLLRLFNFALYATITVFFTNVYFNNFSKMGEWGDFFGGVLNPLLTFLTFMGLLITIILQQKELKQSRKEFQGQKESLENQEFDDKFFQLLGLFNNIINNLSYLSANGRIVLKELNRRFENEINGKSTAYDKLLERKVIENIEDFQKLFNILNNDLDTSFKYYFINLYQIIKYIDRYSNNEKEAKEYTNILRAQLSKNELVLLFYNAIGVIEFSGDNYKIFIEKYSFFEHLRYEDLGSNQKLINIFLKEYKEEAFGKNIKLKAKWQELQKDNKSS